MSHAPGPSILSGKTGHDLPVWKVALPLDEDIFAAFTGPEGGITALGSDGDCEIKERRLVRHPLAAAEDCEDFDFIDLGEAEGAKGSRRQSEANDDDVFRKGKLKSKKILAF